ncbi:MAG: type I restriction endonuclease [Methylomonas sp.]|nr:MAG: type I restriction endonuclease [Methylomonas sp.]
MVDVITENLDLWSAAMLNKSTAGRGTSDKQTAYGIKKLRDLILELAVLGKLVSQDPNDIPARELLKEIESEKQGFIKAGKFKAPKTTLDIDPNKLPYILPIGWEWIRLGNCSQIERGGSPRPIEAYLTNDVDGLNWIKIGDTQKGCKFITSTREKIKKEGLVKTRMVYPGDFLLTNSMSFGRPYISMIEGCIHDGWLRIHPPALLDKDYLYNLLQSPYVTRFFAKAAAGAVVQNLNADKVRELLIALPPFEEQKRIAAKVDELMALCDQLEQQQTDNIAAHQTLVQTLLDTLTQAADGWEFEQAWSRIADHFDTLFTTETSIDQLKQTLLQLAVMGKLVPQDSSDEPAIDLLRRITSERIQSTKQGKGRQEIDLPSIDEEETPYKLPNGWEWVRLGQIINISSGDGLTSTMMNSAGDIPVYGGNGVTGYHDKANVTTPTLVIGRVGYYCGSVHITPESAWVTDNAFVTTFSKNNIYLNFLNWLLKGTNLKENENATAQPVISGRKVYPIVVGLPPKNEQHRIVAKLDELMTLCDTLKSHIAAAQTTQLQIADAIVEQAVA